jgi:opacity protein-like surface antigen
MLRKVLAAALFAVLLPYQALAQVERPGAYVETRIGLFKAEDNDARHSNLFGSTDADLRFDPGWAVEVATGYYMSDYFRGELALGWRQAEVDDLERNGTALTLDETYIGLFTAMLNGYLELPMIRGFRPFIGAGAGFGYFDVDIRTVGGTVAANSGDFTFAWQGLAGVAFHFTPNIAVTGTYSYLGTVNTEDFTLNGLVLKDYRTHTLMAGIRYFF